MVCNDIVSRTLAQLYAQLFRYLSFYMKPDTITIIISCIKELPLHRPIIFNFYSLASIHNNVI